jgi:Ras-related protein Rab-5C
MTDDDKVITPCCDAKVVLLCESGVGKTSIIKQFTRHAFDEEMESSISSQFSSKTINIPDTNKAIRFDLWDTAGQEKYRSLAKIFYKDAKIVIFVFDMTIKTSFEALQNYWHEQVKSNCKEDTIFVLVGNKLDLYNYNQMKENEAKEWADSIEAIYCETSAKTNDGIYELFEKIGKKILNPNYNYNNIDQKEKELYEKKKKEKKKYKDDGDVEEEKNSNDNKNIKLDQKNNSNKKPKRKCC